jgi:hypothetical protein
MRGEERRTRKTWKEGGVEEKEKRMEKKRGGE